jgi:hypothetical protein
MRPTGSFLLKASVSRIVALIVLAGFVAVLRANDSMVVNAAPGFTGGAEAGRKITLSSLKGKPVVLVIAPSPKDRDFQTQMRDFKGRYGRLASVGTLFFAAFTQEGGRIPSNIPFILVDNPSATASAYDVGKGFAIAVIGRDGNLDCLSTKPLPGQRVLDLSMNNADVQLKLRR